MSREKLYKMFHELHKKRKCFTGLCLIEWIQDNCIDQDEVVVNSHEQAADIAEKLLDIGVISPVTRTGDTPLIKPGDYYPSSRSHSNSQSEGGTDVEFPPVTLHSVTNSGYWLGSDTSDTEAYRTSSHHAASHVNRATPYSSPVETISRSSSVSSVCIFRPDSRHFYCFTDIDDEVFYGIDTRVISPTPSTSVDTESSHLRSFYDDKHLKMMSVAPEFVLGIIYARRKKNQEAAKYVHGLPASVVSGVEKSLPSFWFCLSACNDT
ncbi:uncharacterized protein [Amphiura filiformis]|uniref:uncharacterized protein n=1 Tax=Amphiura filiformis TaxID=82378 RepID=UPI003B220DFC